LSRVALGGARACAILAAVAEGTQDAHHEDCRALRCLQGAWGTFGPLR
jgi:hypothetical protein